MPRELVTKGSRFYCVSTTPDICKTPVGSATPPIPYMIKGEFSEATGVSKNIRSNGEPVVISNSTVIPKVTGDEAGTAKGIKSGTVAKRVQHDQKSSTVSFNGERAIREGDTVFMNDRNTRGKVLQRGGGGGADASSGEKFDAAILKAANAIDDAKGAAGEQIAKVAETEIGGKVFDALDEAVEMGEIKVLGDLAERMKTGMMDAAVKSNNRAAGMAASLGVAVVDIFMPTNILDFAPGAGKLLKVGAKAAKAARKTRKAAKLPKSGKPAPVPPAVDITPPVGAPGKRGSTAPPVKGTDGGKSRGKGKKQKKDKPSDCCPKNAGPAGKRTSSKHPVHFGTGEEVLRQTDFAIGGTFPIVWTRCYRSGSETEDWSILGARWASPFTSHLSVSRKGIVYHDDTGRALRLPLLAPGEEFDHRGEGFILSRTNEWNFTLTWRDGSRDHFGLAGTSCLPHGYDGVNAMLPPEETELCQRYDLRRSEDAAGHGLDIVRFGASTEPVLLRIATDDGRVVEAMRKPRTKHADVDLVSHVEEVRADRTRICHVRYDYKADPADAALPARRCDLASQTDRAGATRHYRYTAHLLTAYTTYGGFEHRLEWISLAALRERWSGSTLSERELAERHPITADNSYQARAIATRTADGRDEVMIDYLDEDTTRVTEPSGTVFDYTFDENWLAVDVGLVPPGGGSARSLGRRTWSDDGMLLEETDALFNTRRYGYDSAGNLVVNTDAEDNTTLLEYDTLNRPIRITDALGNATTYAYDDRGNLASATNALGHVTRFEYDKAGRTSAQVDAKGNRTLYGYDDSGRLTSHTDCSGFRSYYRYDADDNLVATLDALEQETAYTRDAWGQVTTITHPDGTQEHYAYDADGNAIRHTDALGYQTHYRYDGHGMPVEQINALGHSVHYRYDAALRLVELINGNGESYRFSYTPEGLLASETTYEGKVTEYRYDRAGQLISYECCGVQIFLERDRMGRLILKTTPDGLTRYQYDALGRLTAVTAPHAENGFVYDAIGQLLEEHSAYFISEPCPEAYKLRRVPDHYFVMRYGYDELGNRIQTVLPDGHRIDVLRYGSGHWHGVLWDGEPVVDVERDRLHRERRRQIGPKSMNLVATRSYDAMSHVSSIELTNQARDVNSPPLHARKLSYDAVGNLVRILEGVDRDNDFQRASHYTFDPIHQLVEATKHDFKEQFTYDGAGKIIATLTSPLPSIFDDHERRTTIHGEHEKWNKKGNLEHRDTRSSLRPSSLELTYNAENILTEANINSRASRVIAKYFYDALGRRIAKDIISKDSRVSNKEKNHLPHSQTTVFVWSGDLISQARCLSSSDVYIFEPDSFRPLAFTSTHEQETQLVKKAEMAIFNCDPIGSPLQLVSSDGHILWEECSTAWGGNKGEKRNDLNKKSQNFRFPGQYLDTETGLHYNRYRYYDPNSAKYISPDPIGLLGGINTYQYVPNPLTWSDVLGLSKCNTNNTCNPCVGRDPASAARAWQGPGNAPYLGQDAYQNVVVSKGTVLYTLYPHGGAPGNYFSDSKTVLTAATARGFNDAIQTAHKGNWKDPRARPMRTQIHAYILGKDLCMAKGLAANNMNLGNGGGTQYFIENQDKIHLLDTSKIIKFSR